MLLETNEERQARIYPIILSEYNPSWSEWYTEEKANLGRLIGRNNIARISHFGSTSVLGLTAKPTVDILLEITENADIEKLIAALPDNEYICLRQQTMESPDLVMFLKGYTDTGFAEKVFHIHVRNLRDWDELYFRDYLIAHPEAAAEYAALKRKLLKEYEHDRDGYTAAKGEFIKTHTKRAKAETRNDLLESLGKIHTTPMGEERIKRNLNLQTDDVVTWCKDAVQHADIIFGLGKNWYAYKNGMAITINAHSYTIITAHKINAKVRVIGESDYDCLPEFLYQAIYIPEGEQRPPRSVINDPEIFVYIKDFGAQKGDLGVVAEQNGQIIGAAWTRIIPAYGHIDEDTPELAISILPEFRGYGIGTKLMKKLFNLLRGNGCKQTSLSVQKNNPAVQFYQRLGYEMTGERFDHAGHEDYLMIKHLTGDENEIETVKRLSGIADSSRIAVSEIGWTSRTYIVDGGKIIFKFPRNKKFQNECKKEISVLELLQKHKFSASTPILNWTTDNNAYFGFYGVEGNPIKDVIHTLTDEQKIGIGTQLGVFLKQLHNITDYGEVTAQTLEEQVAEYTEMYQKDRSLLEPFFNESELKIIDDFFVNGVPKCMTGSGELVFCHGDLDYNNTLVDDKLRVGVIDFGDAGLYDRSQDFRGMDDDTLREAMMKAYGDEIISRAAAKATSKMIDILNLPYIIKNRNAAERDACIKRIRAEFFSNGGL